MRKIFFYTHTHWDREWHQPFESFRAQLIPVVRNILGGLASGDLPKFYLDGQAVIFEDLLEIDASLEVPIKACMAAGKLTAGPWYVLADQMLVSGESLIRNLQFGLAITSRYGAPANIGYCPDTFGHSQDLPRILSGFGINNAVVWRGVPLLKDGPLFWWCSPDNSRVLAYHLTRGYYQTVFHEALAHSEGTKNGGINRLSQTLLTWVKPGADPASTASPYLAAVDGALLPVGADHVGPPGNLNTLVRQVNEQFSQDGEPVSLEPTTLADYLALVGKKIAAKKTAKRTDKDQFVLPLVAGELRNNAAAASYERSYLLYGVLSTRLYLKRANRCSEYKLARICEPLFATLVARNKLNYPQGQFDYAWKLLLKNQAHDSICGCSIDAVHAEMMARNAKLDDIIQCLLGEAANAAAGQPLGEGVACSDPDFGCDGFSIFNLGVSETSGPVPVRWLVPPGTKIAVQQPNLQIESRTKIDYLFSGWGAVPYYKEVEQIDGWLYAEKIPGLGMQVLAAGTSSNAASLDGRRNNAAGEQPVKVSRNKISNGLLEVTVHSNGGLTIRELRQGKDARTFQLGHKIIDVGDGGDSYNFDPLPEDRPVAAKLVSVRPGKSGPLVGSLLLSFAIEIPESAVDADPLVSAKVVAAGNIRTLKRSSKRVKHLITTELALKRSQALVFFDTSWQNLSDDHRLEVVFDTGEDVRSTLSENHFSLVRREHKPSGKRSSLPVPLAQEAAPDRYPCQRFFIVNNQAFFNTGLPEYGVQGKSVSITILRAISWLSKGRLWTRGGGAGPNMAVPQANCRGYNLCSYGWAPLDGAAPVAQAYRLAEQYEGTLWATRSRSEQPSGSLFAIDNEFIRVVAFYFDVESDRFILRLLNVSEDTQVAKIVVDQKLFGRLAAVRLDGGALPKADAGARATMEWTFAKNELKTLVMLKR